MAHHLPSARRKLRSDPDRFGRLIERCKRHPLLAATMFAGVVLIGFGSVAAALKSTGDVLPSVAATWRRLSGKPLIYISNREKITAGVIMGFQLARLEIIQGPLSFRPTAAFEAEATATRRRIRAEVAAAVQRDGLVLTPEISDIDFIHKTIAHYNVVDSEKHTGLMLGIAQNRLLAQKHAKPGDHAVWDSLAFSALANIDPAAIPDKEGLFRELQRRSPDNWVEMMQFVDELSVRR